MLLIQSSLLEAEIVPEVGGKIGQIRDRESGYEFLIPAQKPYRTIPEDGDWTEYDTGGMDDCFPNIAAGPYPSEPWTGTQLPDLGHWTHGSWNVRDADTRQVILERSGQVLPHRARKTVRFVDARTLELSYRIENTGNSSFRYVGGAPADLGQLGIRIDSASGRLDVPHVSARWGAPFMADARFY